jgi:hypothetical protein
MLSVEESEGPRETMCAGEEEETLFAVDEDGGFGLNRGRPG